MEFALPIRIRWDLDSGGESGSILRIASRIREAEPLFVELSVAGEAGLRFLRPLLDALSGGFTRISVTLGLHPGASGIASGLPLAEVTWRIASASDFPRLPEGAKSLSFTPDGESIGRLPGILAAFFRSGATTLHLPNINAVRALAERGRVPVPEPGQYAEVERALGEAGTVPGGRQLVVHDYFLWRVLARRFPGSIGERLEFGGCQAGGALAYVDPAGGLYPCDSLPVKLGNLGGSDSFQALWDAPGRCGLVDAIRSTPSACAGCEALPACKAGCRGMAHVAKGTLDAPDPSCPVPVPDR